MPRPPGRRGARRRRLIAMLVPLALLAAALLWGYDRLTDPAPSGSPSAAVAAPKPAKPKGPPTTVAPTGLHWLATTTFDFDLGRPMDVALVDDQVFVLTRDGLLTHYDPGAETFRVVGAIEQNRQALKDSPIADYDAFHMRWFRAFGLYLEEDGGRYTAYVAHHLFADECFYFRISTLTFALAEAGAEIVADWQPLYTAEPCIQLSADGRFAGHQAGGRMVPYDQDRLLVSIGDHEMDGDRGPPWPLDPDSPFGKMMLVDRRSGAAEVHAIGLRNPQGLLVAADGTIYATDHGPKGGDELDVIEPGASYGWPEDTYGILYGNQPWPLAEIQGRHDRFTRPLFAWLPSLGISGLTQVRPGQFELWGSDLIVSSLKAQSLYRVRIEEGRVMYVEPLHLGHRIRDVETMAGGQLLVATDDDKLLILSDAGPVYEPPAKRREVIAGLPIARVRPSPDAESTAAKGSAVASGRDLFEDRCAACHRLDGEVDVSVHLNGVLGRQIGSVEGYPYSAGLLAEQGRWQPDLLKTFLQKGAKVFPGTAMPKIRIKGKEADRLIEYLATTEG